MAMVELINQNHLKYIVSQNVDGIHRKSGVPATHIAEVHGNSNIEICEKCLKQYMRDHRVRVANRVHEHKTGRKCEIPGCDGDLKDTIINYGENLLDATATLSSQNSACADLILVMGCSMTLSHVAGMVLSCKQQGG